ncbi:putative CoA-transferase alpha subunit (plasmid) [Rhodococcus opacus B4]|uniref:Putative CoA-transferase alpha subunit n=1 Tax=Rhodococcus opacus (strain B4) TaxID=632772 RepID=C1BDV6_RHOOB|nr:putative CoA-transferase alpha subunit [Rhodococcus opacus B4]
MVNDQASRSEASAPTRTSKLHSLQSAVELIKDGDFIALGGLWFQNNPSAAARELVRAGKKGLRLVAAPPASYAVDLLLGAGCVKSAHLAHVSFEHLGMAPNFRRVVEQELTKVFDCDEATILGGLMATLEDLPYHPVPSVKGTDIIDGCAQTSTRLVAGLGTVVSAPAIRPDVCLLHVQEADAYGNVRYHGTPFCDPLFAKASTTVIVTADVIVNNDVIRAEPHRTVIPGYLVDAVVEAPYGAHPCASQGHYPHDEPHLLEYIASGASAHRWNDEYLGPFVHQPANLDDYIELVGGAARIDQLTDTVR